MSHLRTTAAIQLRPLTRLDLPDVLAIERSSFSDPWDEALFDNIMRSRRTLAIAADLQGELCGYLVGEVEGRCVQVLNLCVDAPARRRGVGGRLVSGVTRCLDRRMRCVAIVAEANLPAQLLYRSQAFRATAILRDVRAGCANPDSYWFEYGPRERAAPQF